MSAHRKRIPKGDGLLPPEARAKFDRIAMIVAVIGVLGCAGGAFTDPTRFGYAYLTGFLFTVSLGLGGLFFVILQHLVRAGWSVAARRIMEWMSTGLVACVLLFIPIIPLAGKIFKWMKPEAAHDHLIQAKVAYLNPSFFYVRAAVYLVVWAALAMWFYSKSREQDRTGDVGLSAKMRYFSAPAMFAFAITLTFAAFDWAMSLDPHWFSTIFGVYYFAGCAVAGHAVLALITMRVRATGVAGDVSTIEHQHDIGKLLFGFVVFWAYIGFSQFILIWYANIPEETIWYRHRWEGGWSTVSLMLFFGHFVLPFLILLSRTAKRTNGILALGSILLLVAHYIDIYWLVMPNLDHHPHPSWIDLAGVLGPLGVAMLFISKRVLQDPVFPLKDPHLKETLKVENL